MAVGLTPIAAFAGAFGSAMLVLAVAQRAGASRMTLILTGVALSSVFSAAVDLVVTLVPDALNGYSDFRVGGLGSVTLARVGPAAAVGAVCLTGILLLTNELDLLALGTETARSLGLRAGRMRVILLALAAGLAGAAVPGGGGEPAPCRRLRLWGRGPADGLRHRRPHPLCPLRDPGGGGAEFGGRALLPLAGAASEGRKAEMIELAHLSAGYGGRPVVEDVSFAFRPGEVTVLLGPNGCGKTTLLKTALGLLAPLGGQVLYDGADLRTLAPAEAARKAAYMPQNRHVPRIEARRMALHGRFPYLTFPRQYRPEDYAAADTALEAAGAAELAGRMMDTLSGGQRQKVYLAMALAQQAPAILMDEPTTWLDPKHQLEVMATARRLAAEGRAVGLVSHELSLALRTADHVALLAGGRLAAWGTPEQVYRSGALEEAFGVKIGRMETENGWHYYYL